MPRFVRRRVGSGTVSAEHDSVPVDQHVEGRLDSFEIHPRMSFGLDRAGGVLGISIAGFIAIIVFGRTVDTSSGRDLLTAVGVVGGLVALLALYGRHYLHTNMLYVTPTAVGHLTALLSRHREVPRDRVARVVHVPVSPWWSRTDLHYVLVVGTDGRCLWRSDCMYYGEDDMRAFATAIGVPYEREPRVFRLSRLQREIPGALPLFARHALALILGVLVVGAALLVLAVEISGSS